MELFAIIAGLVTVALVAESFILGRDTMPRALRELYLTGIPFLGLGIQPPAVSWGNMLSNAQGFLFRTNGIWLAVFPGLFIFLTVLFFNLLGDGLRDAMDPRSVRR